MNHASGAPPDETALPGAVRRCGPGRKARDSPNLHRLRTPIPDLCLAALGAATVTNKDPGLMREMTSDSAGAFSAPSLPAGIYEVRGQMAGFRQTLREAEVVGGSTTTVDLQPASAPLRRR